MLSLYLINFIRLAFQVYSFLIVAWCLTSWVSISNESFQRMRDAVGTIVEPYLSVFRRIIPTWSGIDFSPIIALFVLNFIGRFVISTLGLILI